MLPDAFNLQDQKAIVVGRGDEKTKTLALALAEAHASLLVITPTEAGSNRIAEAIGGLGVSCETLVWDTHRVESIRGSVEDAVSRLGGVDVLVNDLATEFAKPFVEMSSDEWQRALDINLNGPYYACSGVAGHMLGQKAGRIINVASGLGARAVVNTVAFGSAMGGLLQFTRTLALEWAREDIKVNAIVPGWMPDSPEEMPDNIRRYVPLQRWGTPEDLGGLLVYLASTHSHFITGETIFVDGGVMTRT